MHWKRRRGVTPLLTAHPLMSLTGISLSRVLASKNCLRFTRFDNYISTSLNDVMALILLNDVVALKN